MPSPSDDCHKDPCDVCVLRAEATNELSRRGVPLDISDPIIDWLFEAPDMREALRALGRNLVAAADDIPNGPGGSAAGHL